MQQKHHRVTLVFSSVLSVVRKQTQDSSDISLSYSFGMVFFQIIASITSFGMLLEVSYPTQLIAKCALPIFALISIQLFDRRVSTIQRYIFAIAIIVGVVLFVENSMHTNAGISIIICYLGASGILFGLQEMAQKEAAMTQLNMIFATHLGISIFLGIGLYTRLRAEDPAGLPIDFINFLWKYPETLHLIGLMAVAYANGQLCVGHMLSTFGDKQYSAVMAIRKMCNLIFSVFIIGNPLVNIQWIGVAIVFTALFADVVFGSVSFKSRQNTNSDNVENGGSN